MMKRELPKQLKSTLARYALGLGLLAVLVLAAAPAQAQLRSHELQFVPPTDARVVGFHVYVSGNSMTYADWRDDINFVPPVQSGAARYTLTGLESASDVYIAMKSYDAVGQESALSNEIVLAAVQQCLTTGCNDNNPCTVDTCSATNGCSFDPAPMRGSTCSDGNASTYNDVCTASGACAGTPGQCNVDADCGASTNVCAGPRVCSNHMCVAGTPVADGTSCSDGNSATRYDICESGTCRGYACGSDAQCGDNAACNGVERCVNRVCVAGTPMVCGDGNRCNGTETCVGSACVAGTPMSCPTDDGPCFDAFCDPAQGCRVQVHPDGSACMTTGTNAAGQCASGICVADTTPVPEDPRDPRPDAGGTPTTCDTAYGAPTDVHQVLTDTPETSRKIVWSAPLHPMGALLEYRADNTTSWKSLRALPESSSGCDAIWSVTLVNLKPRVRYTYRVSGASAEGRVWSELMLLRTGPVSSREKFKFAFFASNGLDASTQSPQAAEVVTQIKKGGFPLVLGGGGYALSNEAMASGAATDAGSAIAAWKEQARPVTGNSIFAPVLGDTEVESFTHAERAADYAEFMAASGSSASPTASYSYDFNGAHFLALHAPNLGTVHPGNAAGATHLAWIESDLAAARAAGARWIVVYMHADLFSSERGNTANATVRTALGDLFQRYGVNLVLSGDGDSYERTKALRGNLANPTAGPLSDEVTTATDGIVFVRAGSGGRTAFAEWLSTAPPAWSAVRDNDRAVFLRMTVDEKTLAVTAFGIDALGKKTVVDRVAIH